MAFNLRAASFSAALEGIHDQDERWATAPPLAAPLDLAVDALTRCRCLLAAARQIGQDDDAMYVAGDDVERLLDAVEQMLKRVARGHLPP